jgi:hypothetical protein
MYRASCPPGEKRGLFTAEPFNAEERKNTMPSKKQRITVYLGPEEYSRIQESATRAGLSLSTFCKRVCTGTPVPGLEHRQAVRDILKASADLGRWGGLFKLALSEGGDKIALSRLLREIDTGQNLLKAAARKIA